MMRRITAFLIALILFIGMLPMEALAETTSAVFGVLVKKSKETEAQDEPVDFTYEDAGAYARVSITGTHAPQAAPRAERRAAGGENVLEAWTVIDLSDDAALSLAAVITALPAEGRLSAYTVCNDQIDTLIAADLQLGDGVSLALSADGAQGLALVAEAAAPENPPANAYALTEQTAYLADILSALQITLTENNYQVSVENDDVRLSADRFNKNSLSAFTITAARGFEAAALTLTSANGKDSHTLLLSYAAPAEKSLSYSFANLDDSLLLLNFLTAQEIYTVAIDDAFVSAGDETAIELIDYIGDYLALPAAPFEQLTLTVLTREGESYDILLSCPEEEPAERTLALAVDESTQLTLTGRLPERAPFAAQAMAAPAEAEAEDAVAFEFVAHRGIGLEEPLSVTVSDPAIARMTAAGMEIFVLRSDGDGTLTPLLPTAVEGDAVTFVADRLAGYIVGGYATAALADWTSGEFDFTVRGLKPLSADCAPAEVTAEEGVTVLGAWNVESRGLLSGVSSLSVAVSDRAALMLDALESVDVYAFENGALTDLLAGGLTADEAAEFVSPGGFALVRDSGFRRQSVPLEGVTLSGMLPKNASASALDASESDKVQALDGTVLAAYDITITNNGADYQPSAARPLAVEMAVDGLSAADAERIALWHIRDDGAAEPVTDFAVSDGKISFVAEGLSVYAATKLHTRTYYFYTFDEYLDYVPYYLNTDIGGEEGQTYMQIVREGETPVAPQNPVNPQDQEAAFAGWYLGSADTGHGPTATVPYQFSAVPHLSEDESVYLYAKFSRYIYVIFHDQFVELNPTTHEGTFPVAFTRRLDLSSEQEADWYVDVTQYSVSYEDPNKIDDTAMVFVGWSQAPITTPGASLNDDGDTVTPVHTNNGKLYATETTHLYPIFAPVKWISFYSGPSGSRATYYTDTYYLNGVGPTSLPGSSVMTRDGSYDFAGWYINATLDTYGETVITGADCVKVANADGSLNTGVTAEEREKLTAAGIAFENTAAEGETPSYRIKLTSSVALYAYWTAKTTANYTVVIVKQSAEDANDSDESNNTYYYSESFTLSGTITATLDATDPLFDNYRALNTAAGYNAIHGTTLTDETNAAENPYANYTLSTVRSDPSVTITADGSSILYFRYNWNSKPSISEKYTLRFVDPMANPEYVIFAYALEGSGEETSDTRLAYNTSLDGKAPSNPISTVSAAGLLFKGWYADRACTTPVFFHEPTVAEKEPLKIYVNNAWTGKYKNYVVYSTMPAADLTIYAGWNKGWFMIQIDPNYGELTGNDSTFFSKQYGDTFQEYVTVRRDYVESDSGSWYYAKHDRQYYGLGPSWEAREDSIRDRGAFYTQAPGNATEFKTFEYEKGVYRYAGWYEVYADGSEAASRYDFSHIVDHDITLRLRWMKVGAFYLQYDAGSGMLKHDEENEVLYLELDGDSYADDADVLITRTAAAPEGYEFVGWKIRSDESEKVYRAGQTFHLLSKYMATVQGKNTVFLDAVYERIPTATIVYHANGGAATGGAAIDYGSYSSDNVFYNATIDSTLVKSADLTDTGDSTWEATATVSHIVNNSKFVLSNAAWLSLTDATFAGWCENRVYDSNDADHPLLKTDGSETYRVGANEGNTAAEQTVHLYAIWQVDAKYHLNETTANANFGGTWDAPAYSLSGDIYTQSNVYVGSKLSWPPHDPVYTGSEGKSFLGWATSADAAAPNYDFSQPVAGALNLYAVWGNAITRSVKVVDSSNHPAISVASWVDGDGDGTPDGDAVISLTSARQAPSALAAAITPAAPSPYAFSFATVVRNGVSMNNIQEERVDQIYYSPQDGKVHLVYARAENPDVTFDEANEQLYFVYYQVRTPLIDYLLMEISGNVTNITASMDSAAPRSTANLSGVTITADEAFAISSAYQPMTWLPDTVTNELSQTVNKADITHYNFAIGAPGATNSNQLNHKTEAYTAGSTRPELYIKNTWRGLYFSQDGGTTWFNASADSHLYVVFYTEIPTVVTLYNRTVGLPADMDVQFDYDYWIEEIDLNNHTENLIYTTRNPDKKTDPSEITETHTKQLAGGDTFSAFTFTTDAHTYRVTFVLKPVAGFGVTKPTAVLTSAGAPAAVADTGLPAWVNDSSRAAVYQYTDDDKDYTFSYTVKTGDSCCGKTAIIPFTNTRESVDVSFHVAQVDASNGVLTHQHDWIKKESGVELNHSVTLHPTDTDPTAFPDPAAFANPEARYAFGAIIYGSDLYHSTGSQAGDPTIYIKLAPMMKNEISLAMLPMDPNESNPTLYSIYLVHADGTRTELPELAQQAVTGGTDYKLYYLYYPQIILHYVVEHADGSLTLIQGSTDGTSESNTITYDRQALSLNGQAVTQTQLVEMPPAGLTISQEVGKDENGNDIFNIPPLLDNGTHKLDLIYYKLGAISWPARDINNEAAVNNISVLTNNDPTAEKPSATTETLTLHTRITDHMMQWRFEDQPWWTLNGWPVAYAIYRERGYSLTVTKTVKVATGYNEPYTVTIESPAINRDKYTVHGTGYSTIPATPASGATPGRITFEMQDGDSVTIQGLIPGAYTITESGNDNDILTAKTIAASVETDAAVTDNSTANVDLQADTELKLINTPKEICRIGSLPFHTLSSAVDYIINHSTTMTETIEMLTDYLMPASDTPVIPAYLNVTLTTANNYQGSGSAAAITRKGNVTTPMFSNLGALTLGNVILDGNNVSGSAMISNEGALTLGGDISVVNLTTSDVEDPVTHVTTQVTTAAAATVAATSPILKNAAGSGNGGAIYSLKGTVSMLGGALKNNRAANGAAIYAEAGDVDISGGTMQENAATLGGAIYYTGRDTVTISGGTIGAEGHANTAQNGGAIYMASGTANITGGAVSYNTASASGGALYAHNAYVNVSGGAISYNTAAENGGAVNMDTLTLTVSGAASITHNTATSGNGGAVWSGMGSVEMTGGSITHNTAAAGSGGAIYADASAVSVVVEGTAAGTPNAVISNNTARVGGGVYANSGAVILQGTTYTSSGTTTYRARITDNTATAGSGGGVYANSGAVSMNKASLENNTASAGNGGGLYVGTGAATLKNGYLVTGNTAVNGAGVFVDTGSATFEAGEVKTNAASDGGAVGVGNEAARLYFSGKVVINNNTLGSGEGAPASNVYLNFDSDSIINSKGLDGNNVTYVGVYVAGDMAADLFQHRGVPGAQFASYTSTNNMGKFRNDRQPDLGVTNEKTAQKLFWQKQVKVEVRYLASYADGLPTSASGDLVKLNNSNQINYNLPASENAASEIADALRGAYKDITNKSATAVFGAAFAVVGNNTTVAYDDFITEVNWDTEHNRWNYVKRNGASVDGAVSKLVVLFTEPYYLSIENNAAPTLTVSSLTVSSANLSDIPVINTDTTAGYGYVFGKSDVVQDQLKPVTSEDLVLAHDDSIKILLPDGGGMTYTLTGSFGSGSGSIEYTMTHPVTSASVSDSFTLNNGQIPTEKGGTHELVFGGARAICRIVLDSEVTGATSAEYVKLVDGSGVTSGKKEYGFASAKQAADFIAAHPEAFHDASANGISATIELLVDYMFPANMPVILSQPNSRITFQTSVTGTLQYPGTDASRRATVSRGAENNDSFITATDTAVTDNAGSVTSTLTVQNLNFDGKSFSGKIDGGVIKTTNWNVTVKNCNFNNCVAQNGGGMYIQVRSVGKNPKDGTLTVSNCIFTNCESKSDTTRQGGGAIWVQAKDVSLSDCDFYSCSAVDQGGAVFHRIEDNYESSTTVTNCHFDGCSAKAAGSLETDAKTVTITGGWVKNSVATDRNGGGINIYALNKADPSGDCWVTISNVDFVNCYAYKQNGGAFRSTSKTTTVENCTFTNTSGNYGGAIAISSGNAAKATIRNVQIDQSAAMTFGGGIFCTAKELIVEGSSNIIKNCTAVYEGGGIYHGKINGNNANDLAGGSSLSVTNCTVDNCASQSRDGGGVYTRALTVSMADSTVKNCTSAGNGGGVCRTTPTSTACNVTLTDTTISNNTASGSGGGLYTVQGNGATLTLAKRGSGCSITDNISSGGNGGGIYTEAKYVVLGDSSLANNQTIGNGGGIYHNNENGLLTIDGISITGNICGDSKANTGSGAGVYTLTNAAMKGPVTITGNRLRTANAPAAAGFYMPDGKTLTLGAAGSDSTSNVLKVTGNLTVDGKPSDLRLPDTTSGEIVNDNKVVVLSGIGGEVRVVNAKKKLTQFGSAPDSPNPAGFTDAYKVFWADDGSLYGIVDRQDTTGKKIIWGGDPICKITDGNGRLLYIDAQHVRPAVFDRLDSGDTEDTSTTSAFSTLRGSGPLYYVDGTPYNGTDYQVKMLVEDYTAEYYITATGGTDRNVTLTTARTTDSLYPYRGREGTRCTILRDPNMDSGKALVTAKTNLTLTNIVLDGGSENGVTPTASTRVIDADYGSAAALQITLGRNATLQNAAITGDGTGSSGNGGGVYLNNGARLAVTGGAIRNCSATNGGGVYIDGSAGAMTMSVGTITRCTASGNGGGVYFNKGTLTNDASGNPASGFMRITGGSITRCTAQNGGGVYLNGENGSRTLHMSGGSIASNRAVERGGGIFVGDSNVRIYFSGAPYVNGSTSGNSVVSSKACNLEMDQTFDRSSLNPGTVIVSSGLSRGATIGVYVPGDDSGRDPGVSGAADSDTLYDKHGAEMDPFATFTDGNERGLNYFLNDRNGMKGGRLDNPTGNDYKVYWRIIYAISVKKQVLSDDPADITTYRFRLTLTDEITNADGTKTTPSDINGVYGDLTFINGFSTFTLTSGQTKTADLLPLGFNYEVEEVLIPDQLAHFHTSAENWDGRISSGTTVTGSMTEQTHFNYAITFSNLHAICKVTDEQGRLLYTYNSETATHVPAVYSALVTAFNKVNAGNDNHWLYLGDDGNYYEDYPASYQIQMLIPEYETESAASLQNGRIALLTTADRNADDGFPYIGGDTTAKITRAYDGDSLITVNSGSLTLGNITLDGGSAASTPRASNANGGIIGVNSGSRLTVGTGATLQNAATPGSGAAVYLAQGAAMNISGAPKFINNVATGLALGTEPKNGDDSAFYSGSTAKQDIYIAGYNGTTAGSLVVTGNIDVDAIGQGAITVWAAENPHYIQNQQFAVMQGGTYTGLDAFRNARPDAITENPLKNEEGTPQYLYGVARDGKVFWSGSMDLTISKTVAGDIADPSASFAFTVSFTDLKDGYKCDSALYSTSNGIDWTIMSAAEKKTVTDGKITFNLAHNQKIVISVPRGVTVSVSESGGNGECSYAVNGGSSVSGSATGSMAMNADTTVAFTNTFSAVSPTGVQLVFAPYLLMAAGGMLLALIAATGRKRRREEA